jgi:hypothetical protein
VVSDVVQEGEEVVEGAVAVGERDDEGGAQAPGEAGGGDDGEHGHGVTSGRSRPMV